MRRANQLIRWPEAGSYACCTQQAVADFHKWFWAKFFLGAGLALTGGLVLSVVLPSKTAVRAGLVALGVGVLGFLTFNSLNMHGWTGHPHSRWPALLLAAVLPF